MAIASFTPPYPLLFDHLLASSWTWFAICLATIATSLRALLRHRLLTVPQYSLSPLSPIPDNPHLLFSSLASLPSTPSTSSLKGFQRRVRSKSTPCLRKPYRDEEGFLCSSVKFLSSVLDAELSPKLKKIFSASELSHGDCSCQETEQNPSSRIFLTATNSRSSEAHNLPKLGLDADERQGVGSVSGTLLQDNEESCNAPLKEEQPHMHEDLASWLPSWAYSLCDPLQMKVSFSSVSTYEEDEGCDNSAVVEAIPWFEKQFGWDKLLESRFGSPWTSPARCKRFAEKSCNVVKMWPDQHQKLVKALDADALALDVCARKGIACTGNTTGEIFVWELGRKAYPKAMASSFPHPVVALSMNPDQGATVVGSSKGLGIWDYRSPNFMPFGCGSANFNNISLSALKSRGNGLCFASSDNSLSMYDLRMPLNKSLYWSPSAKRTPVSPDFEDEANANLMEKLTCDDDDDNDFWDGFNEISVGNGVEPQNSGSLLSQLASFMRRSGDR